MGEHTPGPWAVVATTLGPKGQVVEVIGQAVRAEKGLMGLSDEYLVAVVARATDESEANIRLITAAPDLLEALEGLLLAGPSHFGEIARNVLAKARGEA
jgi:hypothetical protein